MSRIDLSSYDKGGYSSGNPLKILLWILVSSIIFRTTLPFPSFLKVFILKVFGAEVGNSIVIKPSVNIKLPWRLAIGDNTWIGEDVWIDNLSPITIGSNCCLSQGCYLLTGNHDFTSSKFELRINDINIENGSWVGAKSIVCPGVTLKSYSMLTVGSVASKDLDMFGIYRGNPAVKIKEREVL